MKILSKIPQRLGIVTIAALIFAAPIAGPGSAHGAAGEDDMNVGLDKLVAKLLFQFRLEVFYFLLPFFHHVSADL